MILSSIACAILGLLIIISLVMFYTAISNRDILPFYRECITAEWEMISGNVKSIMALLMRFIGIGFLMSALSMACAVLEILEKNKLTAVLFLLISFIFQAGLSLVNLRLHAKYKANSPWKESMVSAILVAAVIVIAAVT